MQTENNYPTLVNPRNQCTLAMGYENPLHYKGLSDYGVGACIDDAGNIRLYKPGIVGVIFEKTGKRLYTIRHVYTHPAKRRQGMARSLLALARVHLGDIRHSDNLTPDGKAFANAVG